MENEPFGLSLKSCGVSSSAVSLLAPVRVHSGHRLAEATLRSTKAKNVKAIRAVTFAFVPRMAFGLRYGRETRRA